jgi:tight adherence protein C
MRKNQMKEYIWKLLDKILRIIPDWITGDTSKLMQKYVIRYGNINIKDRIYERKRKTLATYLAVIILFIIISLLILFSHSQIDNNARLTSIERPEYGQVQKSLPLKVRVNYKDGKLERSVYLKLKARALSEEEKKTKVNQLKSQLETIILGENTSLQQLFKPLNLIVFHRESGATISWKSDYPEVIKETGEIDFILSEPGQTILIEALITLDGYVDYWQAHVSVAEKIGLDDYKKTLERRLDESITTINKSTGSKALILPESLGNHINLEWYEPNDFNLLPIIVIFCYIIFTIYLSRYQQIDKEIKERNQEIISQLPDFINKLVLLLNAGLVVSTAISKIANDYEATISKNNARAVKQKDSRVLYEELVEIQKRVQQTKAPLIYELKDFSKRTGISELIRVSNIIGDNINKGSSLAEKLQGESEFLWLSRKKKAEEQGRLAETKLTFPLVILLIVLIMITIAPALFDM